MTVLAPARIGGLMMGVWFLATSVGNFIAGRLSGLYESLPLPSLFGSVAGFAIVAGLILMVLTVVLTGPLSTEVACTPGAPVAWQAVAIPNGTTPFGQGNAEVEVTASAQDPNFGGTVAVDQTQVVRLRRA